MTDIMPARRVLSEIMAERHRQMTEEGWTPEHDDDHVDGSLADAAACYVDSITTKHAPTRWPWDKNWWKPSEDRRRNLVKAGALIVAEIERLDRLKAHGID